MKTGLRNGYKINLVETVEELKQLRKDVEGNKVVGMDTETTGLSFISDHMVGLCLAWGKPLQGYYMPIRHIVGNNLPVQDVSEFAQYCLDNKKTMLFNRNFDFSMLEKEGVNIKFLIDTHDVQPMCWMATNEGFPKLKVYIKNYLKMDVTEFGEAVDEAKVDSDGEGESSHNFGETDPSVSFIYAGFDAVGTVLLGRHMWASYPYIRQIYPVDNRVTECCRLMGKEHIEIDYNLISQFLRKEELELRSLKAQAIAIAGYEFNVGSNRDKVEALSRFVTLTTKTKTGQFSVKDEVLQEVDHPLAEVLVAYSKKVKFISSYLKTLLNMQGKEVHLNFKTVDVPTGRMASGQVKGNDYYARFNIQSTPKTEVKRYLHKTDEGLGFILNDDPEGAIKQQKAKAGLRDAFVAPEGYYFVTADFKGEEICICANLSNENVWLDAINKGEDVHKQTAQAVFGVSDDEKRGKIKIFNFMCVGKNSMILTSDGVFRPYSLNNTHLLLNQYGAAQKWSCLEVENQPTYTIEFRNGIVEEYREGHKLQVYTDHGRDWVKVEDLNESHDILYSPGHFKTVSSVWLERESDYVSRNFTEMPNRVWDCASTEFAYLMGYYLGDGHCSINNGILTWLVDSECVLKVRYSLTYLSLKYKETSYEGKDYVLFSVYSAPFGRIVEKFFGRTTSKTISDKVFEVWGRYEFRELLAGLMDSDGTKMRKPVFVNTNKNLVHKVALAAIGIGLTTQLDYRKSKLHGVEYSFYELTMMENHNLIPISVSRRVSESVKVLDGFRYFDRDLISDLKDSDYNWQVGNIRTGRSKKVSFNNKNLLEKLGISNVRPTRIKTVTKGIGTIYTIMCDTHEYLSSNMVSHNTLYGANEFTIAKRTKSLVSEAKEMLSLYYARLPNLTRWKKYVIDTARRKGVVFTYFGRPRLLYRYYSSSDPKMKAFADRSAVNSIVQGCLPSCVMIETKSGAELMSTNFLNKIKMPDGRDGIVSARGNGRVWLLESKGGDFLVADEEHGLLHGSLKSPKYRRVCEGLDVDVLMSPLRRKPMLSLPTLYKILRGMPYKSVVMAWCNRNKVDRSSKNFTMLFVLWLLRKKLSAKDCLKAASLRSVCSVNGFNLKKKGDYYKLCFFRARKTRLVVARFVGEMGIGSVTATSGLQYYQSQGFYHKNTGADIMRILLCRLFSKKAQDKEFDENVRICWHVHDEVNVYVKKDYLHTYYYIIKEFMTIKPDNWKAPLTADIGIGTTWGNCVDAIGVTKDNKLVLEGINEEMLQEC
jgi:DNA polymerase I-like protein with 3'-5' exonuclease and polymerase domains